MSLFTRLRRPARDASGSAVVEFALVVPVITILLVGIVEIGLLLLAQGLLDSAALRASRTGSTGYTPDAVAREEYIRDYVASQGMGLLQADRIAVSATAYSSFAEIGQEGKGTPGFGGPQDVVVYQLVYPWQGLTPLLGEFFGNLTLSASLAVRNEPF